MVHGDFGSSYTYRIPVGRLIAERLQVSLPLAVYALGLAVCMALPAGIFAAAKHGSAADSLLTGLTQVGLAVPNFWLGMLLVLAFAVGLRWVSRRWLSGVGCGRRAGVAGAHLAGPSRSPCRRRPSSPVCCVVHCSTP